MAFKERYCYNILKKYSLLVDFDGEPHRKNVPAPVDGETFNQWKRRVLGDEVTGVVVYTPWAPKPQEKLSSVQVWGKTAPIEKMFKHIISSKNDEKEEAVEQGVLETKEQFIAYPKETLARLLEDMDEELDEHLELPLLEFFKRFLESAESSIDIEEMLRSLILGYNSAIRLGRAKMREESQYGDLTFQFATKPEVTHTPDDIADKFHREMVGIYDAALRLNPPYKAKAFLQMLGNIGGKATADKLLGAAKPSSGFTDLYLRGPNCLRLSVEYLVLKNPWRSLFTDEQLAVARKRLKEARCAPPVEDSR